MGTVNGKTNHVQHSVLQTVWEHLGAADVGTADQLARYPFHSVQLSGVFGGATVVLQGSEDGMTYFTLKDVTGASASTLSNARFDLNNVPNHVRPSSSGGGITTDVTVTLTSRSLGH